MTSQIVETAQHLSESTPPKPDPSTHNPTEAFQKYVEENPSSLEAKTFDL